MKQISCFCFIIISKAMIVYHVSDQMTTPFLKKHGKTEWNDMEMKVFFSREICRKIRKTKDSGSVSGSEVQERKRVIVMARHGENIRKRKDGRWEGRFLAYSEEKGRKLYHSVYAWTYDEVREKLTAQKNLLKYPQSESENRMVLQTVRFADIAQSWLTEIRDQKKLSTYVKYSVIYRNYMEEHFQEAFLADMTEGYVREKLSDQVSDSVCKSIYCVLNQILKSASVRYSVTLPVLKRPVSAARKKAVLVLTKSEQKRLFDELYRETDIYKSAVLVCLFTGLRLGELCALKWDDIDQENRILTINRTVQRLCKDGHETKTILVETVPKSECSKREIPLSEDVWGLLADIQNDGAYVFSGRKPLEPRTMQYQFKKILKVAGLPDRNFHILRHTFSTNCIEGGMDVKSLSEMLGHSSVQITLNRYVHPSMAVKRQCVNDLSGFYGQIRGQAV